MKGDNLTPKQETFVQRLFAGDSQREAYKAAYGNINMKDEVIDVRACELAKNSKVKVRLEELQKEAANAVIWDKARSLRELAEIVSIAKGNAVKETDEGKIDYVDNGLLNAATKAIAELNKVLGLNAPEKSEVDSTVTVIMEGDIGDYGV